MRRREAERGAQLLLGEGGGAWPRLHDALQLLGDPLACAAAAQRTVVRRRAPHRLLETRGQLDQCNIRPGRGRRPWALALATAEQREKVLAWLGFGCECQASYP